MDPEQAITLVEYNAWANHRVFLKAAHLPSAKLHGQTSLSHRTVIATLVHILDTQWYWREGAQSGNLPGKTLSPPISPTWLLFNEDGMKRISFSWGTSAGYP